MLQRQLSKHVKLEDNAIHGVSIAYDLSEPWLILEGHRSCRFFTSLVLQKDFRGRTGDDFAICQSSIKLPLTDHQFSLDRSSKTEATAEDFTLRSEIEDILANITRRKARAGVLSSARRA